MDTRPLEERKEEKRQEIADRFEHRLGIPNRIQDGVPISDDPWERRSQRMMNGEEVGPNGCGI